MRTADNDVTAAALPDNNSWLKAKADAECFADMLHSVWQDLLADDVRQQAIEEVSQLLDICFQLTS